jgi:hypothetical protein
MLRGEPADQSSRAGAGAESRRGLSDRIHDAGMMRQSQVIIRAEIHASPAIDFQVNRVNGNDNASAAKLVRLRKPR